MNNWTKLAENRIEEAMANGEFDDLPGKGRPLDLAEYFAQPAAERAGAALLKNANVVPPEVELLRGIGELEEALAREEREVQPHKRATVLANETGGDVGDGERLKRVARIREELQEKRVALAMAMEKRRRREPRGVD